VWEAWIDTDPEPDAHVELLDHLIEKLLAEEAAGPQWWRLSDEAVLAELERSQAERSQAELARVQARRLALLAEAEKREATLWLTGLPTASWLADHRTHTARAAREEVRLAVRLGQQPLVAKALSQSRLSLEQARVISAGVDRLPVELDRDQRERVERHLVGLGREFGPYGLSRLVNRAVEVVAPEIVEEADRRAVERLEAAQQRGRYLSWQHDPDDGSLILRCRLPVVAGQKLVGMIGALAAAARKSAALVGVELDKGQANADALVTLAEHYAGCRKARRNGAERSRLLITVSYDTLVGGVGTATLVDSDQKITAHQARVLACDAGLLPVVMGGGSVPLDVGRAKRLFTGPLREVIRARDQGCAFPGCDRQPAECDVHHITPWQLGGATSYANGVTVCTFHHHLVEPDPNPPPATQWAIRFNNRGHPEFGAPEGTGAPPGQRRWRQHHRYTTIG